jgi:hypothetical protein
MGASKNPCESGMMGGASNLTGIFMIKTSLFADQEREAKLNKLGDALRVMEQSMSTSPPWLPKSIVRRRAPAASAADVRHTPLN